MNRVADVLIIGAGPAGLAVAYELKRRGLGPRIIDSADRIAVPWRQRHDALRLNTHRWCSSLPGLRIPPSAGAFPSRDAFVAYLEEYERFLSLPIEWGVRVEAINRAGRTPWRVETCEGPIFARDVIVATGPDRVPVMPQWPGAETFTGDITHAAQFRRPSDYRGRRVLVVGGGNSAFDLASCLTRVDVRQLWMSIRHGATVISRRFLGVPVQPLAVALRHAPRWYQDGTTAQLSWATFGRLERFGVPKPPKGALTRFLEDGVAPAIDDGFVAALRAGRAEVVPEIERFAGANVRLADDRTLTPDTVLCATGYRTGLEPIVGHLGVLQENGRPRFFADDCSEELRGLWFVGHHSNFHGNLYARGVEARRLARALVRRRRAQESAAKTPALAPTWNG